MDLNNNAEKYRIANYFGEAVQMQQLIEEMSELTKAICKYARLNGQGQPLAESLTEETVEANLVEEMADVKLVLEQVIYLHGCEKAVEKIISEKIKRTVQRNGISQQTDGCNNADILDVACYFLLKEKMSSKKLQKLCYYSEAWSETLSNKPISKDSEFEAWVHGPENIKLHNWMKSLGFNLDCDLIELPENKISEAADRIYDIFNETQIVIMDAVWDTYGSYTGDQLEAQTHIEDAWIEARGDAKPFQHRTTQITPEMMKKCYKKYINA